MIVEDKLLQVSSSNLKSLIYEIRDKQVMLDSDVAKLYGYEVRAINQTVKRNINRFPEDFCFKLTEEELQDLKMMSPNSSQFVMSSTYKYRGSSYLPYAFTEQGIAMLSGVLKNSLAVEVSIKLMKTFVEMRKFITANKNILERVITIENTMSKKFMEHDKKFEEVFDNLNKEKEFNQKIFFEGQIYDAYSLIINIIEKARKNITIIDNYIDRKILDMLIKKNPNVEVNIITTLKSKINKFDLEYFNKQYAKVSLKYSNDYHDRFIIIDYNTIYHCGASLKDLGKKTFAINKMEDKKLLKKIA